MLNTFVFVYQRSGSAFLTRCLGLQKGKAECIAFDGSPLSLVTGSDILERIEVANNKPQSDSHIWVTYLWDWWGSVEDSSQVPTPYEIETPMRWGPDELSLLRGDWEFFFHIRDPRNNIESVRRRSGERAGIYQTRRPIDYFKTLSLGARNRTRIALDARDLLSNVRIIPFEDTIADPFNTVSKIFNKPFSKQDVCCMIKDHTMPSWLEQKSSFSDFNYHQRWKAWSEEEKQIFKCAAGNELIELGYEKDFSW